MREALPNAFLFGLTGTPINRADRNTFYAFGAEEDAARLHEPLRLRGVDPRRRHACRSTSSRASSSSTSTRQAIDQAFSELTGGLTDLDKDQLAQDRREDGGPGQGARAHPGDLRRHRAALPGEGRAERLRRMVVTFDRESCLLYKTGARRVPAAGGLRHRHDGQQRRGRKYAPYDREPDAEEKLLDRFRDPAIR